MAKFIKTSEKVEVDNYPYGFKLKTTLFHELEFNAKKGYRVVTTTINPKTDKLNKPKKSTYSPLIVRFYNEDGHIKNMHFDFNGAEAINKGVSFVNENFDLFSEEEIKSIYSLAFNMSKIDMKAQVIYCGSKVEDLKPFYDNFVKNMVEGFRNPSENLFDLTLDVAGIKSTSEPDYQPFVVTSREIIEL